MIIEPLQAGAGMIPCPKRYLQRVREICDKQEVPLIFDEIQTYIRIGTFFAAQYYDVVPDIIALGKALGGGLPLGATLIRDGLAGFEPDAEELHTFASNTLSMVGAVKLIEIVQPYLDTEGFFSLQAKNKDCGGIAAAARRAGGGQLSSLEIKPFSSDLLTADDAEVRRNSLETVRRNAGCCHQWRFPRCC